MARWKKILLGITGVLLLTILAAWIGWVRLPLNTLKAKHSDIPRHLVIAHRGASHLAPEETAPAYILAREFGTDYLEIDIQRTKDGVLVAFHDDTPSRTTNVAEVFPGREKQLISEFTLDELKKLDAGSWFNRKYPERARKEYVGTKILSLSEILDIGAENGKKYPVYIETKSPKNQPGVEKDLVDLLKARGWLDWKNGALPGVIFQSFYSDSLLKLRDLAPKVPRIYLIAPETLKVEGGWAKTMDTAARVGDGIGPVGFLCWPWLIAGAHRHGLMAHAYTLNEPWQFRLLSWFGVDGFFTDRCDALLDYYGRPPDKTADEIFMDMNAPQ